MKIFKTIILVLTISCLCNVGRCDFTNDAIRLVNLYKRAEQHSLQPDAELRLLINSAATATTSAEFTNYCERAEAGFATLEALDANIKVTPRQLRLALIDIGIMPSSVTAAINTIPYPTVREQALIEWEYASYYERSSPTVVAIGSILQLTPAQVTQLFNAAKLK